MRPDYRPHPVRRQRGARPDAPPTRRVDRPAQPRRELRSEVGPHCDRAETQPGVAAAGIETAHERIRLTRAIGDALQQLRLQRALWAKSGTLSGGRPDDLVVEAAGARRNGLKLPDDGWRDSGAGPTDRMPSSAPPNDDDGAGTEFDRTSRPRAIYEPQDRNAAVAARQERRSRPRRRRRIGTWTMVSMVACAFAAGVYAKDTLADAADTIRHLMRVAAGPPPIAAGGWDDPQSPPELRTSSIPSNGRRAVSVGRFAASLPLPETYGLYVVSDDQLARLEPMRMRVPDTRIALPGLITKPSPVVVPDGPLSFIVYQRELMSSAPDQASIRVIAKVARVLKFGAAGQPTTTDLEDTWAARSVSVDLTVAPVPGHPEMMLVRPADPEQALSPGRYMLVFKNQAYDFAIDGAPTDATHCLERTETQNGAVYTECRSPNGTT